MPQPQRALRQLIRAPQPAPERRTQTQAVKHSLLRSKGVQRRQFSRGNAAAAGEACSLPLAEENCGRTVVQYRRRCNSAASAAARCSRKAPAFIWPPAQMEEHHNHVRHLMPASAGAACRSRRAAQHASVAAEPHARQLSVPASAVRRRRAAPSRAALRRVRRHGAALRSGHPVHAASQTRFGVSGTQDASPATRGAAVARARVSARDASLASAARGARRGVQAAAACARPSGAEATTAVSALSAPASRAAAAGADGRAANWEPRALEAAATQAGKPRRTNKATPLDCWRPVAQRKRAAAGRMTCSPLRGTADASDKL